MGFFTAMLCFTQPYVPYIAFFFGRHSNPSFLIFCSLNVHTLQVSEGVVAEV